MSAAISAHEAIRRVLGREALSRIEMEAVIGQLMDEQGDWDHAKIAALLVGLAMKGETVSEIAGAAAAMRARVIAIPHDVPDVVDTCGTGGDGKGSFNVSTAAAVVTAAAGIPVAKHGNRSVSSRSGSADVLAALGVDVELTPEDAARALAEIDIAFLFAPKLHPAIKAVMPVRKSLGVRTLFNVLGPLTNPAGARRQVMGVYAESLVEPLGLVLAELGAEHALVVHGSDGLDEITTTGPSTVAEVHRGEVKSWQLDPAEYGVARATADDLLGGSPEENAADFTAVLDPDRAMPRIRALRDIVAVNAAAAIWVGGGVDDYASGLARAHELLASGAAAAKLDDLRRFGRLKP
ncbi:MAG: anthranilate phosphoribosyltransferase [Acidobacteriota bacterium]